MRRLLGLALIALPLAACGSNSGSPGAGTATAANSNSNRALQFAQCMRSHGVPNFPDPVGGRLDLQIQRTPNSATVNGVTVNAPAFQSAMQACHAYLPNGGQPTRSASPVRSAALRFAQCMRSHGVANFPDPQFQGGGVIERFRGQPLGIDPNSPAFKQAQQACQPLIRKALGKPGP